MPDRVDLHIHTDHSDGRQSPREVVDRACHIGLKAIAITDHDSVSGYTEAARYARGKAIEVIPGIELSSAVADDDIHILGYLIRPDNRLLDETVERFRHIRSERGMKMVKRLASLGIDIDYEEVLAAAHGAPVGRPHVAEVLAAHGVVDSYNQAFDKYLALNGPVYVPKAKLSPAEAIDLIHQANGVAVMAHPMLTDRDAVIPDLVAAGLDGLEIYHPSHTRAARKRYRQLAKKYDLVCTGGSDSHNRSGRYGEIGEEQVPYKYLEQLKARWARYEQTSI
jgi:predicted metal-dependent phosphoesterase TrpH